MKNRFRHWLEGTLAVTLIWSSGISAIAAVPAATPTLATSPPLERLTLMTHAIEQTNWELVSYRNDRGEIVSAWHDRPATFQFEEGRLTGTTGCNRFFSSYTLADEMLSLSPGGSTLMACFPEALAEQETAILGALTNITGYAQAEDELRLLDASGNTLLTLKPLAIAQLTHTEWTLMAYNNGRGGVVTPLMGSTLTAQFHDDGRVTGSAGCNTYRASYERSDELIDERTDTALTIGAAATTRRLCAQPDGVMEQECQFLSALSQVTTYTLSHDQLVLKNADGAVLAQFGV